MLPAHPYCLNATASPLLINSTTAMFNIVILQSPAFIWIFSGTKEAFSAVRSSLKSLFGVSLHTDVTHTYCCDRMLPQCRVVVIPHSDLFPTWRLLKGQITSLYPSCLFSTIAHPRVTLETRPATAARARHHLSASGGCAYSTRHYRICERILPDWSFRSGLRVVRVQTLAHIRGQGRLLLVHAQSRMKRV
ncbi:hypothetical protein B484DRAFT_444496 [Ochromonadaceae sp. CCMP2298]|nr:hypothetical protein B484DRAFT_444496 [Ochromonadaceae sp. CCMP2298]